MAHLWILLPISTPILSKSNSRYLQKHKRTLLKIAHRELFKTQSSNLSLQHWSIAKMPSCTQVKQELHVVDTVVNRCSVTAWGQPPELQG